MPFTHLHDGPDGTMAYLPKSLHDVAWGPFTSND